MQILAQGMESRSGQWHPTFPTIQTAQMKRAESMRSQPVAFAGGPHQPLLVCWNQLPVKRSDLALPVDENERAVMAMPAAVGSSFNGSQIDCDAMLGRRRA
jgi:hypothetical protein